ncbi:biotin--[acetyl-CoA-carboxylase] ligase [Marinobacter sp.]|uniref:biotin--[acetyl-CoA-carboxylase] ligase n=1 Tax=Marinobacter sp. TaxID=50741 RepID=UPI00384E77CA
MKTKALINLLSDRRIHSGASLATQLGVSRTAIWKQIRRAQGRGYRIETLKGRGYRLEDHVDLLDAERIRASLPGSLQESIDLRVLESVDSTNAEVARYRAGHSDDPGAGAVMVCLADTQTAGRGRRGRAWLSPPGENLYMSMGLTLRGGFTALEGLSLVIGVAVAEALERLGLRNVGLKWPNDLQHEGRKLAGILVELQGELEGVVQVVAGVGLNVHMREAAGVDQPWTSLSQAQEKTPWRRNDIAAELTSSVLAAVDEFAVNGFEAFRDRWQQRDVFYGHSLRAVQGEMEGIGRGIDASGHYQIETEQGIQTVRAGEVSMRVMS